MVELAVIFLQLCQVGILSGIFFRLGTHSVRIKVLEDALTLKIEGVKTC